MPQSKFSANDSLTFPPALWRQVNASLLQNHTLDDSVLIALDTIGEKSFFLHKDTQSVTEPLPRISNRSDWWYGSFAIILIVIVFLRVVYVRQIDQLLKSFFVPGRHTPGERLFPFRLDLFVVLFLLVYCTTFALLIVSVVKDFHLMPAFSYVIAVKLFFFSVLVFLLLMVVKVVVVQLVAIFFSLRESGLFYQDLFLSSGFITASFIIPLLVINVFSASLIALSIALGVILVFAIFRIFRLLTGASKGKSFSVYHFILYFCTLEILPLLIIGKILQLFLMRP